MGIALEDRVDDIFPMANPDGYWGCGATAKYEGPNNATPGRFTSKMALVVASLARGESAAEAAMHGGVSKRTVFRWRHRPEFAAVLELWLKDRARVVETLRAVLDDPQAHPRLKLRAAGRLAGMTRERVAASSRPDDLDLRDERTINAVMAIRPRGPGDGA